jgi:hypothetical protein
MSQIRTLSALRTAVGAGGWLAPRLTAKLFGIDADDNPQLPYVARLFAIRDLALAAGVESSSADARRLWLRVGIACDLADAAAGILAGRNGELSTLSTVLVTGTALMGTGLGLAALQGTPTGAGAAS